MPKPAAPPPVVTPDVLHLMQAIVWNDVTEAARWLDASPGLACASLDHGANREVSKDFFFPEIQHYLYAGDTPLHAAAASYGLELVRKLLAMSANPSSRNRRGAEPLHCAADGGPDAPHANPQAQAAIIRLLIESGADPNALDNSGVAPLHRAVRQRSTVAVAALLHNGATVRLRNKSGSTPLRLAVLTTGKSGSGSAEAKAYQKQIIGLLLAAGADPQDLQA